MTINKIKVKLNTEELYSMIKNSISKYPESWTYDEFKIYSSEIGSNIWIANGLSHIEIQCGEYDQLYGKHIKLSLLQGMIIHILYLRKIRKRSILYILLRYLILGTLAMGILIVPIIFIENNYSNFHGDITIDISKRYYRDYRLSKLVSKWINQLKELSYP